MINNKIIIYIAGVILIGSVVLNTILIQKLFVGEKILEQNIKKEYTKSIEDRDNRITSLQTRIDEIIENNESATSEIIEEEKEIKIYKNAINNFADIYFTYTSEELNDRREKMLPLILGEDLMKRLAPEIDENEVYSNIESKFSSKLNKTTVYICLSDDLKAAKAVIDVNYTVVSYEGEAELDSFYFIDLEKDKDDKVKIADYKVYPKNEF